MAEDKKDKDTKDEGHAPPKKKSKVMLIAIIAVAVIGIGVGSFLFMKSKSASKKPVAGGEVAAAEDAAHGEEPAAEEGHGGEAKKGGGTIFNLDPFIVNLQDNSGTRYLKLTINLELSSASAQSELTAQTTQIRDSLIILLSSKSYTDIGTVEGKYQMRDEIVARVNQFLTKSKIKTAYFTEFVVQ
ncbi:MAG: flagellar basal body-associated FliL family protein [Deltaproteobacteria bacterium]|nr:flagellar basal body-associated FliL family protein [Deltaproteobacteria bacterium]